MEISNADRVVFPDDGITKGEVCAYYSAASTVMFPYLEGRALTVERFPKGIGDPGFMQKNAPSHFGEDLIDRISIPKEGGSTTYAIVSGPDAIVAYANLGVITFHVPPVRVDNNWHPDWIIWDLDPPAGSDVGVVREAAVLMRGVLSSFGIEVGLMTSGSKGYHLRAAIHPTIDLEEAALVARGTAALAAGAHPDQLTLAFKKVDRSGRVFVDWLRNHALSTAVSPWSLRPRPGAPVATPIEWSELDLISPDGVRLHEALERALSDTGMSAPQDLSAVPAKVESALEQAGIVLEPFDRFRS